jgi:hypothetical protein
VSLQTGAVQEAVDSYRKSLDISERLAAADPTDAQAQHDLMFSHYKLGNVQRELFAYAEAATRYQAGIKVLDRMIAAGQNVEQSTRERDILQRRATSTELAAAATVEWLDLLQVPEKQLPKLLPSRCTELAKQQKFDDVAQAAGTLRTMAIDAAKGTARTAGRPALQRRLRLRAVRRRSAAGRGDGHTNRRPADAASRLHRPRPDLLERSHRRGLRRLRTHAAGHRSVRPARPAGVQSFTASRLTSCNADLFLAPECRLSLDSLRWVRGPDGGGSEHGQGQEHHECWLVGSVVVV